MVETFQVYPGFYAGLGFSWTASCATTDPRPWLFQVEESPTGFDQFEAISPEMEDSYAYEEPSGVRRRYNKDANLFFRVRMRTANGKTYYSAVRTALGDLPLQEFLYAKEIMRKELLQMRNMAGVPVQLYRKIQEGTPCTNCLDPITQEVLDPDCEVCKGTKYIGGYHGPYASFGTFSVTNSHKQHAKDGAGVDEDRLHDIRLIARPLLVRDDIVVDTTSDRRYVMATSASELELRRIPIIQVIKAAEAEVDCAIYSLGTEETPDAPSYC
jgi:hypothetical protein